MALDSKSSGQIPDDDCHQDQPADKFPLAVPVAVRIFGQLLVSYEFLFARPTGIV